MEFAAAREFFDGDVAENWDFGGVDLEGQLAKWKMDSWIVIRC